MKKKIVIKVSSMSCDKCRSKAMAIAVRTTGVISVGITGDGMDMLEVVGDGDVDPVCLVNSLRCHKKLGHVLIVKVEDMKDKIKIITAPDTKTPTAAAVPVCPPNCYPVCVCPAPPHCYPAVCPQKYAVACCDEPEYSVCAIM